MVTDRIGLPSSVQGFSLFEVFGALERNMLGWEKVCLLFFKHLPFLCLFYSQTMYA